MHDSADALRPGVRQDRSGVVFCVPRMDYDWQLELLCQCDLRQEGVALRSAGGVVVVIIQAAFSHPDRSFRSVLADQVEVTLADETASVVRMNSGGMPDEPPVGRGHFPRCASGAEDIPGAAAGADADDRFGPAVSRPLDYIAAVAVERFVGEVRVAVDERCVTEVFFGHLR